MATNSDPYCPIEEGRGEPDAAAVIAALVLTGETTLKDLEGLVPAGSPDFVLDRVDRLLPAQVWEELGGMLGPVTVERRP